MSYEELCSKIISELTMIKDDDRGSYGYEYYFAPAIPLSFDKRKYDIYEPDENIFAVINNAGAYECFVFSAQGIYHKSGAYSRADFFLYEAGAGSLPRWLKDSPFRPVWIAAHNLLSGGANVRADARVGSNTFSGADIAGTIYGDVSAASTAYSYDKFATPQGHGFAAERANHMYDKLTGHDARILGDDNMLNGADRIVDGVYIQSKYCKTGSACIKECFSKDGFRYWNADGTPMQIEVPSDKYDDAVKALEGRIKNGQMKGINDPAKAKEIVRKGHYTYQQAKNIAKAGTIDSLKFDAATGMITGACAGGISAGISFAVSIWNGEDFNAALENAGISFMKVGGMAALTSLCASQLAKAGMNSMLVGTTDAIVGALGPKASAIIVNAFRSGSNIYGAAAMKSASKLLRGNIITGVVVTGLLSAVDLGNIFMGRISFGQMFKNVTTTAASVAGGTAGWMGGAAAGAAVGSFIPFVGTAVGGVIGGLLGAFGGGSVAGEVTNAVLDEFIEDDAKEMLRIVQSEFEDLAGEYLVNQEEAESTADRLKEKIDASTLKDMYASSSRYGFAEDMMRPIFDDVVRKRRYITLPDNASLLSGIRNVLDRMSVATA